MSLDNRAKAERIVTMFRTGDLSLVRSLIADSYHDHQGLGGNPCVDLRCGFENFIARGARVAPPSAEVIADQAATVAVIKRGCPCSS